VCFPNGFGDDGLPTGMSLLGRPFAEAKLTGIARRYQARTAHHAARPKLTASLAD
jgi:Asp-tRNA(Asn)/Glu-tRNA(Gln) amidotransferase A subunit family amidase